MMPAVFSCIRCREYICLMQKKKSHREDGFLYVSEDICLLTAEPLSKNAPFLQRTCTLANQEAILVDLDFIFTLLEL